MDVQNSEITQVSSQTTTDQNSQQTTNSNEVEFNTPRVQNRPVGTILWLEHMADGKSVRIVQTLDFPLSFSNHPEYVKRLNEARMEIFGDDGKMYIVKNVPVPDGVTPYYLRINSKTGKEITRKVLTPVEANERLAKDRAEILRNREKNIRRYGELNSEGFHLLQDAIESANNKKSTAIAVNNN